MFDIKLEHKSLVVLVQKVQITLFGLRFKTEKVKIINSVLHLKANKTHHKVAFLASNGVFTKYYKSVH